MLAQHMITKPVFEALFGNDHFTKENPVSKSLEEIVTLLDEKSDPDDLEKLERFYKSVQQRAEGIDNAEAKQKIVVELYDSFFKNAFPMTVEKLGIVYTPVPVVDFILHSVEYVLNKEFKRSISDEKVNVIDPFTGTGTFITRLLQSGIIKKEDLERKFRHEIFANEIVLLAYYIASVNIENAFHDLNGKYEYEPFNGICLTDTFQLYENSDPTLDDEVFSENSERVNEQKSQPITVIIGNPPYSVGQRSANDNAQNQSYKKLEARIADTYVCLSRSSNNRATYDSYIKAFRWASDRLNDVEAGVIGFITNSGWLEKGGMDGFRLTLAKEFSDIYVFNLRGAIRGKSSEGSKREGQNVFNIMTGVAITILVKNKKKEVSSSIHYCDIGDYLSRKEKLQIISEKKSIKNLDLRDLTPNEYGDWIKQRNDTFQNFIPIDAEKKFNLNSQSFFVTNSLGLTTNRDKFVYGYSLEKTKKNVQMTIDFFNTQLKNSDPEICLTKISWSRGLKKLAKKGDKIEHDENKYTIVQYRPFCKQHCYFSRDLNEYVYTLPSLFPTQKHANEVICVTGAGFRKDYSVLITDKIPDLSCIENSQCFPLYWYEIIEQDQYSLFGDDDAQIVRHEAVSDFILKHAQAKYGNSVQRKDIFYYVYGILHSKSYREKFEPDLKIMLPRIPLVSDYQKFWDFSKAGRNLAHLHLNYEMIDPYPDVIVKGDDKNNFTVQEMKFSAKSQKDTIIYNNDISISNIPEMAYEYVVNGKSPIEWVMERYQINNDQKTGITNDPNDWATEHNKPRYILDLLLSVINVSVQTVDIVNKLPEVDWDKE